MDDDDIKTSPPAELRTATIRPSCVVISHILIWISSGSLENNENSDLSFFLVVDDEARFLGLRRGR
jgi:hypothetical protein